MRRIVGVAHLLDPDEFELIETCKANSVEPYGYLLALFKALPVAQGVDDYEALLPWRLTTPTA